MNRDSAINTARELNKVVKERDGDKASFVLISSAKAPPFLPEY